MEETLCGGVSWGGACRTQRSKFKKKKKKKYSHSSKYVVSKSGKIPAHVGKECFCCDICWKKKCKHARQECEIYLKGSFRLCNWKVMEEHCCCFFPSLLNLLVARSRKIAATRSSTQSTKDEKPVWTSGPAQQVGVNDVTSDEIWVGSITASSKSSSLLVFMLLLLRFSWIHDRFCPGDQINSLPYFTRTLRMCPHVQTQPEGKSGTRRRTS